jgi:hypothetical protein
VVRSVDVDTVETPRSKGRGVARTTLGIAGVGVLVCCGCGGCFVHDLIVNEVPAARSTVDAFYADLQADRISDAYWSTVTAFKGAVSEEQFRRLMKTDPASVHAGHKSRTISDGRIYAGTDGIRAEFSVTVQGPGGTGTSTVTAIKEEGEWKVAGVTFHPPPSQKPE